MGSFLEEWQDLGNFYYQIDHILSKLHSFQVKQTIWKKTHGFWKKLKDSAKKTQPFGVKWLGKTPKSRSKNKPGLVPSNQLYDDTANMIRAQRY